MQVLFQWCRSRQRCQTQDTLWACNQTSQETVEHLNYMRVGVGVSACCVCIFLLLEESDYKSRCNTTGLNCYVEFCECSSFYWARTNGMTLNKAFDSQSLPLRPLAFRQNALDEERGRAGGYLRLK